MRPDKSLLPKSTWKSSETLFWIFLALRRKKEGFDGAILLAAVSRVPQSLCCPGFGNRLLEFIPPDEMVPEIEVSIRTLYFFLLSCPCCEVPFWISPRFRLQRPLPYNLASCSPKKIKRSGVNGIVEGIKGEKLKISLPTSPFSVMLLRLARTPPPETPNYINYNLSDPTTALRTPTITAILDLEGFIVFGIRSRTFQLICATSPCPTTSLSTAKMSMVPCSANCLSSNLRAAWNPYYAGHAQIVALSEQDTNEVHHWLYGLPGFFYAKVSKYASNSTPITSKFEVQLSIPSRSWVSSVCSSVWGA